MAKLYFRYGTVGSAKTLNLLAVAHNYRQQSKKALLIKPEIDTRFGEATIQSRAGLSRDADILVAPTTRLADAALADVHCLLVDEAQFLSASFVEHLRDVATRLNIPVICYGLRVNFARKLFEGSARLFELADSIEEVKTTCSDCNRKAVFNMRLKNGSPTLDGEVVEMGADESYQPVCSHHYREQLSLSY